MELIGAYRRRVDGVNARVAPSHRIAADNHSLAWIYLSRPSVLHVVSANRYHKVAVT